MHTLLPLLLLVPHTPKTNMDYIPRFTLDVTFYFTSWCCCCGGGGGGGDGIVHTFISGDFFLVFLNFKMRFSTVK